MDSKKLFLKYRRKKEKYTKRLEKAWAEELSPKEALALAKGCSDILDSVIEMAQNLGQLSSPGWSGGPTLDALSDEELERYLESSKRALSQESVGDLEAPGES